MKEILDYLNSVGVTTVRGKRIDLNFVTAVLHNQKYIGEYRYREIVTPEGINALIPKDLFDRVQYKLAKINAPSLGIKMQMLLLLLCEL